MPVLDPVAGVPCAHATRNATFRETVPLLPIDRGVELDPPRPRGQHMIWEREDEPNDQEKDTAAPSGLSRSTRTTDPERSATVPR
jgi:hypothetical protein